MKVPNIRELGELYPKTAILGITTLIVAGGVFILGTGVGFDFSRFFACDPAEGECPGGGFNSGEDISFEVTEETDVTGSTNQGGTNEEVAVAEEATGGSSGEVLGSSSEDSCADGDCDDDGYLNPAVGGNDCDDGNPGLYPGNGCPGDAQGSTSSVQTTEEETTTNQTQTTEETTQTTAVDPCADGDCDGDGYLNPVVGGNDCDDGNANVHPGAGCAGEAVVTTTTTTNQTQTTEETTQTTAVDPCADGDCDGDGYLNPVVGGNDCDDGNANVHPGAGCAGAVAQVATAAPSPTVVAAITNNPNPTTAVDPCADGDCDGDGYLNPVVGGNDCDDGNANVHPGAGCAGVQVTAAPVNTTTPPSNTSTPVPAPSAILTPTVTPPTSSLFTCKSVPVESQTCDTGDCDGDGLRNPAVGGNDCDDAYFNSLQCACPAVTPAPPTGRLVCVNNSCTVSETSGPNDNGCLSANQSCTPPSTPSAPSHLACQGGACVVVAGAGSNTSGCNSAGQSCSTTTSALPGDAAALLAEIKNRIDVNVPSFGVRELQILLKALVDTNATGDNLGLRRIQDDTSGCSGSPPSCYAPPNYYAVRADAIDSGVAGFFASQIVTARGEANIGEATRLINESGGRYIVHESCQFADKLIGCIVSGLHSNRTLHERLANDILKAGSNAGIDQFNAGARVLGQQQISPEYLKRVYASRMDCINNTCSIVDGNGSDFPGCSLGASCQSGTTGSTADAIRAFGIKVEGQSSATADDLTQVLRSLQAHGKGPLKALYFGNTSKCGPNAAACVHTSGEMYFGVGQADYDTVAHEMYHMVAQNAGRSEPNTSCIGSQNQSDLLVDSDSHLLSRFPIEVIPYAMNLVAHDSNAAAKARSRGSTYAICQYNAAARWLGSSEISSAPSSSMFAFLGQGMKSALATITKTFGVDTVPSDADSLSDTHGPIVVEEPSVSISSPQDGERIDKGATTIAGRVYTNPVTDSPISSVSVYVNKNLTATLIPALSDCSGLPCYTWTTQAPLSFGSNYIEVTATDAVGVVSQLERIIVSSTQPGSLVASSQTRSSSLQGVASRVSTGPGEVTLAALLLSALVSLLYTGYTRTGLYRRSEVERIVERERAEGGDMNFSKPEDK